MYYVVYGFLWLVSLLPLRLLYIISDCIYGMVFYVFKYRRDVVMHNLEIAFPDKPPSERKKIAKKFYHNLVDTFIETIKMITMSPSALQRHVDGNWDLINQFKDSGKSIQMHMGHNFNWEWANAVAARQFTIPFIAVYMPIVSPIFERLFYKLRSRPGTILVRATHMKQDFLPYRKQQYALGLVADQNPGEPAKAWWFKFFNIPTPFVKGPAKNAIASNTVVIFAFIQKLKRGHYKVCFSLAAESANVFSEEELTGKFVHFLEGVIREHPDMWLWSHRRWKHQWKEDYGLVE